LINVCTCLFFSSCVCSRFCVVLPCSPRLREFAVYCPFLFFFFVLSAFLPHDKILLNVFFSCALTQTRPEWPPPFVNFFSVKSFFSTPTLDPPKLFPTFRPFWVDGFSRLLATPRKCPWFWGVGSFFQHFFPAFFFRPLQRSNTSLTRQFPFPRSPTTHSSPGSFNFVFDWSRRLWYSGLLFLNCPRT